MRAEQRFNKRSAPLVDSQQPYVSHGRGLGLGICVTIVPDHGYPDRMEVGSLRLHLTPEEALQFASDLILSAKCQLRDNGRLR